MNAYEIRLGVLRLALDIVHENKMDQVKDKDGSWIGWKHNYSTADVIATAAALNNFVGGFTTTGNAVTDVGQEMKSAFERMAKLSPEPKRRKE